MFEQLLQTQKQYFDAIDSARPQLIKAGKELKTLVGQRFKRLYVHNDKIPIQARQKEYAWIVNTDRIFVTIINSDGDLALEFLSFNTYDFGSKKLKTILITEQLLSESGRIQFADEWEQIQLRKIDLAKNRKLEMREKEIGRTKQRIAQL